MNMRIAGSGNIGPGEYDNIHISGSGKVEGPVRCKSFHCAGSSRCNGSIEASGDLHVSGSARIEGDLSANDIHISGSGNISGNCTSRNIIKNAGSIHCGGKLKANEIYLSGSCHAENIDAEKTCIDGRIVCPGLLNSETVDIKIDGTGSEIGSIGGGVINIESKKGSRSEINIDFLFFKLRHRETTGGKGILTVKESIEGDEISLENVKAHTVVGRVVKIGSGCTVDEVQYSDSLDVADDAQIKSQKRV